MVNHLPGSDELSAAFGALADPVRRAVVMRLIQGESTVSELAAPHPMSLPAFLKHLRVLESAGLLATRKIGRVRLCRLTPGPLRAARQWISRQERFREERLDALADYLADTEEETKWKSRRSNPPTASISGARSGHRANGSSRPGRPRRR